MSVPPPVPPSCWRTAPSVTAVYPKGYSCFPCHQNSEAEAVKSASRPETNQVSSPVCVPGLEVGPTPPLASSFQQISSNHLLILKACRGIHPILSSLPPPHALPVEPPQHAFDVLKIRALLGVLSPASLHEMDHLLQIGGQIRRGAKGRLFPIRDALNNLWKGPKKMWGEVRED